jgi:thioredoxin reductase (NADPH)
VHKYIRSLRWNARNVLAENGIERFDGIAKFIDQHTIEVFLPKNKSTKKITAKFILISTGGRPSYPPNILNAKELAITSDDIFYLEKNPGKTLIIGASYIALETAGFLKGFGNDVTVLVRSILLRGFDQGCAAKIGDYMKHRGINFVFKANITNLEKTEDDKRKVTYQLDDGTTQTDTFDTVLFAIGRNANTVNLNLESAGVKVNPNNQKVIVNNADESSTPHIFALGDVADGRPELTPPAVMVIISKKL